MSETGVMESARTAFPQGAPVVRIGSVIHEGKTTPEPIVSIPLAMLNRHGLIAGATGTGKTKSLQVIAEQLSAAGVPVFLADVKGDVAGISVPGTTSDRVTKRVADTGWQWEPRGYPVEFLSLTGRSGAQLRATVSSFGPLLLSRVLGLNETQSSVLALVFKYCDDRMLPLLDFADLRSVLQYLTGEGAGELASYGSMSKQTVGVLLREMIELEQQGAEEFFGEPEFDLMDLFATAGDGRGIVSVLSLRDVQDKPALFSTFMMWMLARLYNTLPEVGDLEKPRLVFFFDEAHLLFSDSSKAFKNEVEKVVRLIRSKGIGVFFITQSPKDIPADILGQLGNRIQHALRAFTPDDEKAMRAASRTFPKTKFYDVQSTLTSLGIGEALVTVLSANGAPTPPFATLVVPPSSRMAPLSDTEFAQALANSSQVREYATPVDRESAKEILNARLAASTEEAARVDAAEKSEPERSRARGRVPASTLETVLKSPVTRTVAGVVARGVMGALFGRSRRRR